MQSTGRNDPCRCGSGKKSKHCCGTQAARPSGQASAPISAAALLERAVQYHRTGQINQAEALYKQVLEIDPSQPDALHLLGVIAAQTGNFVQSAQLIERAIKKNPHDPTFHNNLGNAYRQTDTSPERCINCYRNAIRLDPSHALAHNNLANALKRKGDLDGAIASYKVALRLNPGQLESSLGLGDALQNNKQYVEACTVFRQVIADQPACIDALIGLGATLVKLDQLVEAENVLIDALRYNRNHAGTYYNLGLALNAQRRFEPAAESLSTAIKLQPDYPEAYYHLGLALHANNFFQAAEQALLKALEQDPENALSMLSLADTLASLGKLDEAIQICLTVIRINPQMRNAHTQLAGLFIRNRENQLALESFRTALALGENSPSVLHMIATLEGVTPKSASAEYVAEVFDSYAAKFDRHLVDGLKYDSPSHLLQLARQHCAQTDRAWRLLDLGCGTGLCGVAFSPYCEELVGVDLSGRMLDKARERDLYQRLVQADLLGMMQAEQTVSYDIIIAADVFVYIGDLADIYAEAHRLLAPGGLFLFSVESSDALLLDGQPSPAADYQLLYSGRYAHAASYLQKLANASQLQVLALQPKVLRMEVNAPIQGWCVALAKQA